MSLEDLLSKNNTLMEEHNKLLGQIIATAGGRAAAAGGAPKAEKSAKGGAEELTADTLKPIVAAWLREFKADESDPENDARTDKFSAALKNLGVERIGEIQKASDLERLRVWTAKQVAVGRITPLPSKDLDAPAASDPNDI